MTSCIPWRRKDIHWRPKRRRCGYRLGRLGSRDVGPSGKLLGVRHHDHTLWGRTMVMMMMVSTKMKVQSDGEIERGYPDQRTCLV